MSASTFREPTAAPTTLPPRPRLPDRAARVPPRPRQDVLARLFVFGAWGASVITALTVVLPGARNMPMEEDWYMVAGMTGHQQDFWSWLWTRNNEHLVPLPKLIYFGLLQVWPDFRVGIVVNILVLAAVAFGFIAFLRWNRGYTRWTDAFFPVAFLHLGHWENLGWSWQLQFVFATALACALLLLITPARSAEHRHSSPGPWPSTGRAAAIGACLVCIPLPGATALPFAPLVALALMPRLRSARGWTRIILVGSAILTVVLTVLDLSGLQRPSWVPPTPSLWASLATGAKVLGISLGPAANAWWLVSVLFVSGLVGGAAVFLYRARHSGTWPMVAFLVGGVALALSIGDSRAGLVAWNGVPDRYALIGVPLLCCAYIAYDRYGGGVWRRLGPVALCGAIIALLPLNIVYGLQYGRLFHQRQSAFAADIKAGTPPDQLAWRLDIASMTKEMLQGMVYLRQARVAPFTYLQDQQGVVPPGMRIDGLDTTPNGWTTAGGLASLAYPAVSNGQPAIRWAYNVGPGRTAILTRSFPTPQDWGATTTNHDQARGEGGLAFSVVGQGTGQPVRVEVTMQTASGGLDQYQAPFTDSQAGPRTLVIPWDAFGHFDWQGPIPLQRIVGIAFVTRDSGKGSLVIQRVAIQPGHPPMRWPLHVAVTRHSLPPWR